MGCAIMTSHLMISCLYLPLVIASWLAQYRPSLPDAALLTANKVSHWTCQINMSTFPCMFFFCRIHNNTLPTGSYSTQLQLNTLNATEFHLHIFPNPFSYNREHYCHQGQHQVSALRTVVNVCARVGEMGVAATLPRCQLILNGFLNLFLKKKKTGWWGCSQGLCGIPLHEHKQTDQKAILEGEVGEGCR